MSLQYKVPQNVLIEDRILPFLTIRQLIICFVGGTIAYILYLGLERQASEVWMTAVTVVVGLTLGIAFVRINDIPFTTFVLYALERYLLEGKRQWMPMADTPMVSASDMVGEGAVKAVPQKARSIDELEQLSRMVDTGQLKK